MKLSSSRIRPLLLFASAVTVATLMSASVSAALSPNTVHVADTKKTQAYLKEALVTGGDRAIDDVAIKDIRRASNPSGFERIVIDLEGMRNGEAPAIPRPPYYQVSVSADEQRLVVTLWGHPKILFDAAKVRGSLRRSPALSTVELFPRLDESSWTFSLGLKPGRSVEVFELSNPVRIIVDIRGDAKKASP